MTVDLKLGAISSFFIMDLVFSFIADLIIAIIFGLLINRMMTALIRIEKTQTLALAYLINPDAMLDATSSDLVINNALKKAMSEKGETQRAVKFLKNLKPLTDV